MLNRRRQPVAALAPRLQNENEKTSAAATFVTGALQPRAANRRMLCIALLPILLVGLNLLFLSVRRVAQHNARFGETTTSEARQIAQEACRLIIGAPMLSSEVSQRSAYARAGTRTVREWDVFCRTERGNYQIRIEADERRVFAINRIHGLYGEPEEEIDLRTILPDAPDSESRLASSETGKWTQNRAEAQARLFARQIGISPHSLRLSHVGRGASTSFWDFTYRRRVPGQGLRSLKVSVQPDGTLETIWNPVRML